MRALNGYDCIYEHIYHVPTVKVRSYSLEEIKEKHLDFFIPHTILRIRSRLRKKRKPLTEEELTGFLQEIILILEEELQDGYITEKEYSNYSVIKLPSQIMDEREAELKVQMDEMEKRIVEKDRQLASIEAENRRLRELVSRFGLKE
ncbi:MAG: hypothetical protein J1E61_10825 [Lachnospiraceae bacterium]|nr:hypothetical protein [Lachnospiraceae bacterium]